MILERIARTIIRAPKIVLSCAVVLFVLAAGAGATVISQLPAGGYDNPNSESARAQQLLNDKFGANGMSLIFALSAPAGIDTPAVQQRANQIVANLRESKLSSDEISYWTVPRPYSTGLVTRDGKAGLIAAVIKGDDTVAPKRARKIADRWEGVENGITVKIGGQSLVQDEINRQSKIDLITMESIAIPFTFLVLVWIFGSAVAAVLPLVASVISIVGTAAVLRIIFSFTPVSVFAMNLASALCLALAIDYTLFFINRYREERAKGVSDAAALTRSMMTAGRTIIYTSLTLFLTISTMLFMPGYFLKSLGYAGLAAVVLSMLSGLIVAPTAMILLGDRIDSWDLRKAVYRRLRRSDPLRQPPEQSRWYRFAMFAMKRPVLVSVSIVTFFVLLALPIFHLQLNYPDDRSLPTSATPRQVGDILRNDIEQKNQGAVTVVLPSYSGSGPQTDRYFQQLSTVNDVTSVVSPDGVFQSGRKVGPTLFGAGVRNGAAYFTVNTTEDAFSSAGQDQLRALKDIPAPTEAIFGGLAQRNIDNVSGVVDRIPLVLLLIALSTTVLMFLMTGSLVLPFKALVLNGLSLAATIGILTLIFQDGYLGAFGTTSSGFLNASILPLMSCIAFGVAMDYEVFVLSRIREEWIGSDRSSAANVKSVALGLAHTGRIVTAAAVVMAVVFAALIASQVSFNRMLGAGLCIGVLIDAFLIRTLLVPAVMRLAGRWNWWAPWPLAGWYEKWGLRESSGNPGESGDVEDRDGKSGDQGSQSLLKPPVLKAAESNQTS